MQSKLDKFFQDIEIKRSILYLLGFLTLKLVFNKDLDKVNMDIIFHCDCKLDAFYYKDIIFIKYIHVFNYNKLLCLFAHELVHHLGYKKHNKEFGDKLSLVLGFLKSMIEQGYDLKGVMRMFRKYLKKKTWRL